MGFRLKTTDETGTMLKELQSSTNLRPNILARLAISFSILDPTPPPLVSVGSKGLDFNRTTLTGDQDYPYKAIISQHAQRPISDDEYFPDLFNQHLTRGVPILYNEYKHLGSYDKFLNHLIHVAKEQLKEAENALLR